jgi:hypothetical protein
VRTFQIFILLLAVITLFFTGKHLLPEFYLYAADRVLEKKKNGQPVSLEVLDNAIGWATTAGSMDHTGRADELQAKLLIIRDVNYTRDKSHRDEVMYLLSNAKEKNPGRYLGWMNILFAKGAYREIDEEFYRVFDKMLALAPNEMTAHHAVAVLGFRYWNQIRQLRVRKQIRKSAEIAYTENKYQIVGTAYRYGMLYQLCVWVMDQEDKFDGCLKYY